MVTISVMLANLAELYLDGSQFYSSPMQRWEEEPIDGAHNNYMWMRCQWLERFSVKNTSCCKRMFENTAHPVSQEMIVELVRVSTMRWLRSDNVAILQQ
jgi:hypothetical protein